MPRKKQTTIRDQLQEWSWQLRNIHNGLTDRDQTPLHDVFAPYLAALEKLGDVLDDLEDGYLAADVVHEPGDLYRPESPAGDQVRRALRHAVERKVTFELEWRALLAAREEDARPQNQEAAPDPRPSAQVIPLRPRTLEGPQPEDQGR